MGVTSNPVVRCILMYRKLLIIVITPLLLLPLITVKDSSTFKHSKEADTVFMTLIMAVFWLTEALPLPVTGLIPVFMAPAFGLLSGSQVASNYMKVGKEKKHCPCTRSLPWVRACQG